MKWDFFSFFLFSSSNTLYCEDLISMVWLRIEECKKKDILLCYRSQSNMLNLVLKYSFTKVVHNSFLLPEDGKPSMSTSEWINSRQAKFPTKNI